MASSEQQLRPTAVALHTRDRDRDYHWYPLAGEAQLADQLREYYREFLADQEAKPGAPATFLLLEQADRIGLLLAKLKTERRDYMGTRLYNTLLLEFDLHQRSAVYRLAACLLGPDSEAIQQRFLFYAEERFQQGHPASIAPIEIPMPDHLGSADDPRANPADGDELRTRRHQALRANEANCRRLAKLFESAAQNPEYLGQDVLIVVTGLVGKDKLTPWVPKLQRLIALSRSSSIPDKGAVDLTPPARKKKNAESSGASDRGIPALGAALWNLAEYVLPESRPVREQVERLEQWLERLELRIKQLEADNEQLQQRVRFLENELERQKRK